MSWIISVMYRKYVERNQKAFRGEKAAFDLTDDLRSHLLLSLRETLMLQKKKEKDVEKDKS